MAIRSILLLKFAEDSTDESRAALAASLRRLSVPGMRALTCGSDRGLRPGNWDFAVTVDLADADAYRAFDSDPAHNRIRSQIAPFVKASARVQYELEPS